MTQWRDLINCIRMCLCRFIDHSKHFKYFKLDLPIKTVHVILSYVILLFISEDTASVEKAALMWAELN